ncbi:MAG TPA: hypothetical protein VN371_00580, partial [Chlorobaculum sp.]|nr:hypothetical protein [Chlorobaculum sp.]
RILHGITVGRGDLVESMKFHRGEVDSAEIYEIVRNIAGKVKATGLHVALGGSVTGKSESFLKKLIDADLLDKFETRKIAFDTTKCASLIDAIDKALIFELLWLKSKRRYYHRIKIEDEQRIVALEKRLARQ